MSWKLCIVLIEFCDNLYQVSYDCVFKCCRLLFYPVCLIALCFVVEQAADSEWEGSEYVQPDVGAVWCE